MPACGHQRTSNNYPKAMVHETSGKIGNIRSRHAYSWRSARHGRTRSPGVARNGPREGMCLVSSLFYPRPCSLPPHTANEHTGTPLLSVPGTSIPDLMGNPYWPLPRRQHEGCLAPLGLQLFPSTLLRLLATRHPSIPNELAPIELSNNGTPSARTVSGHTWTSLPGPSSLSELPGFRRDSTRGFESV